MLNLKTGAVLALIVLAAGVVAGQDAKTGTQDANNATQKQDEATTITATGKEKPMSKAEQDRRIDYIEFVSTDIPATKKFYSETFGWKFTDYGPEYTAFNDGRLDGGFRAAREVSQGGALVVLYATDLEGIEARVRENGGTIVRDIFEFPGGRRFHFTDPSGNELAIWSDQ